MPASLSTALSRRSAEAPPSPAAIADLEWLAGLLDSRWRIPGLGWRFGLDSVLGLFPGIGDGLSALIGLYVLVRARELGVPASGLLRMALNLVGDWLVGSVPVVGDLADIGWKANLRNLAIIRAHLIDQQRERTSAP